MASNVGEKSPARETEDSALSMLDVLEEEQKLEEDANAVLGDSDDKNCTYDMGYVARQALYACSTCIQPDGEPAGLCLACSLECHEGHELVELYTKRNFRCDCGNDKFVGFTCKLRQNKQPTNPDNQYNQNFKGVYCTCKRPYPDPEDEVEDEMIQCVICEDWYHGRHLNAEVPSDYAEMICAKCMLKYEFLRAYATPSKEVKIKKGEESSEVDVGHSSSGSSVPKLENSGQLEISHENKATETLPTKTESSHDCEIQDQVVKSESNETQPKTGCLLDDLQKRVMEKSEGACFWPESWRSKLCVCDKCKGLYESHKVSFLTDPADTVEAYEERGKAREVPMNQYEKGMQALSSLDRVQQVEVLHEYNDMKTELKDYLKKFADNGKVVREEDIHEFFTQMSARKKQRVTGSGMQYFCK